MGDEVTPEGLDAQALEANFWTIDETFGQLARAVGERDLPAQAPLRQQVYVIRYLRRVPLTNLAEFSEQIKAHEIIGNFGDGRKLRLQRNLMQDDDAPFLNVEIDIPQSVTGGYERLSVDIEPNAYVAIYREEYSQAGYAVGFAIGSIDDWAQVRAVLAEAVDVLPKRQLAYLQAYHG
ncbi:hypothetical protein HY441_02075 [Candidatus Microgenomates bacterium]|nr:hypothetical protein [Candidatus Microgenomates bacterium]